MEPLVFLSCHLLLGHAVLPGYGAGKSIHNAGKLDQQAIAHEFDDASVVLVDQKFEDFLTQFSQTPKRPSFVRTHKACIADHIGG